MGHSRHYLGAFSSITTKALRCSVLPSPLFLLLFFFTIVLLSIGFHPPSIPFLPRSSPLKTISGLGERRKLPMQSGLGEAPANIDCGAF